MPKKFIRKYQNGTPTIDLLKDLYAEQVVLSGLLNDNSLEIEISDFLKSSHFSSNVNRTLYEKIMITIKEGNVASFSTLRMIVKHDVSINVFGKDTEEYLKDLEDAYYTKTEAITCAKLVYNWAVKRSLYAICSDKLREINNNIEENPKNLITSLEKKIFDLAEGNIPENYENLSEIKNVVIEKIEKKLENKITTIEITTGIKSLDNALGGLHPSDLIILASRPGMGKTSLALHIAKSSAENLLNINTSKAIGFFSLEMSSEQLFSKLISTETSAISPHKIRTGNISSNSIKKHLIPAANRIARLPIYIDSSPSLDIFEMYTKAKKMKREKNIGLLIVDYLQLMSASKDVLRYRNRVQEISEISSGLKSIAKELNIPVLALSQLSRSLEQREDKKPLLSDLRESGSIEQDADIVMFLYREEYYLSKKAPEKEASQEYLEWQEKMADIKGLANIIISKNRYGPTYLIKTLFDPERNLFSDN